MSAKRVIVTALVTVVGIGGIVSGAILLRDRQDIRERAAVPGGRAEMSLSPESGNFEVGETIPVSVYFNTGTADTGAVPVVGVTALATYPYSGSNAEVTASNIQINPDLLATGDWSCPTTTITELGGNVDIEIACGIVGSSGFTASSDTLLATFDLTVNEVPSVSPFVIRFNSSRSIITQQSNGEDILALPQSVGSYIIGGTAQPTATTTLSPSPTGSTSVTPTLTTTASPSPTKVATTPSGLPDAGFSLPTIAGLGIGILAIFTSLALAL